MAGRVYLAGWSLFAALSFGLVHTVVQAAQNAEEAKPKHAIAEVMQNNHVAPEGGKSLLAKVTAGDATDEEKQQLLDFYISLAENEPPRGDADAWNAKTRAVVLAAAKVLVAREGAADELKKATNCAACHKDHKPPA